MFILLIDMQSRRESPANNIVSLRFTELLLDCESNPRFECDVFAALEANGKGETKLGLTGSGKESDIVVLVILELGAITFFKFDGHLEVLCKFESNGENVQFQGMLALKRASRGPWNPIYKFW